MLRTLVTIDTCGPSARKFGRVGGTTVRTSMVIVTLLATVCAGRALGAIQPPDSSRRDSSSQKPPGKLPLKLTVKADKAVYAPGDNVTLTLALKNPTKQPVPLTFATGQKYDVLMGRLQQGNKWPADGVWQWSLGMMFTQMVTTTTIGPGQTITYQVKYPPDDGTKPPALTAGEYCVKATITTMGTASKPDATTMFKVKAPKSR
jgi:hypothetical protein